MTSIEAIVNRQILKWELESQQAQQTTASRTPRLPTVTISRQSGSRGSYFGSRLAQRLGYQRLHRQALNLICGSKAYRDRIFEALGDSFRDRLESLAEPIVANSSAEVGADTAHLCRAVLAMSELGGVVLMGCGGSFIMGPKCGFHMRIIGPREKRIENLIKYKLMSAEEAAAMVDRSDVSRRKFIADLFGDDIDTAHRYDLIVNSALIDVEEMVDTAVVAIEAKMSKLAFLDHDQI